MSYGIRGLETVRGVAETLGADFADGRATDFRAASTARHAVVEGGKSMTDGRRLTHRRRRVLLAAALEACREAGMTIRMKRWADR